MQISNFSVKPRYFTKIYRFLCFRMYPDSNSSLKTFSAFKLLWRLSWTSSRAPAEWLFKNPPSYSSINFLWHCPQKFIKYFCDNVLKSFFYFQPIYMFIYSLFHSFPTIEFKTLTSISTLMLPQWVFFFTSSLPLTMPITGKLANYFCLAKPENLRGNTKN